MLAVHVREVRDEERLLRVGHVCLCALRGMHDPAAQVHVRVACEEGREPGEEVLACIGVVICFRGEVARRRLVERKIDGLCRERGDAGHRVVVAFVVIARDRVRFLGSGRQQLPVVRGCAVNRCAA